MAYNTPRKKNSVAAGWSVAIGSLVGLVIAITSRNPAYFAIGFAVGIAVGYTLDKQNDNKR